MHLNADISSALQQIEAVKQGIDSSGDPKLQMQTAESLKTILDILQDPVFRNIVHVQDSLSELNTQLGMHPAMGPNEFDIDVEGNLVLSVVDRDVLYDYDGDSSSAPLSPHSTGSHKAQFGDEELARPQSQNSKMSSMTANVYESEYAQIQAIQLVNDGTGLGFGIISGPTAGVNVKTILPGGVADRDGRLRSGDHILQIGDVNLHDMGSDDVATVLRQCGTHVRLIVARAIEPNLAPYSLEPESAVVPTRVLADPGELERYLLSAGYPEIFNGSSAASTPLTNAEDSERFIYQGDTSVFAQRDNGFDDELSALPETEKFQVELTKDANGLGITIAGYICETEELSGIFIKSVSPGSAADMSGCIQVNDRIIEVNGQSLQGFSNHQAVELLKRSGQVVNLRLERYLRGPKYDHLQIAIAGNDLLPSNMQPTPSRSAMMPAVEDEASNQSMVPEIFKSNAALTQTINEAPKVSLSTFGAGKKLLNGRDMNDNHLPKIIPMEVPISAASAQLQESLEQDNGGEAILSELTPEIRDEIMRKWQGIVGPDADIVVAQLKKPAASGLGISLEGTVDVEGGIEVRPHHYIRSILAGGPVGVNGTLQSGDELLEVNGKRLLGMNHVEVVAILKELPMDVRMVCLRGKHELVPFADDALKRISSNFENVLPAATDRLVKAKSDGSLATAGSVSESELNSSFSKLKSRSLEPLTSLAMWSSEPQIIELVKGERGLGFSILDYQDPLDPSDTLIVIRSLVPGGVAQLDGRLIPGDRLLFVNSINLENASLDQAVQALKGAPKGIVRIGVAKPLPITDNSLRPNNQDSSSEHAEATTEDEAVAKITQPDLIADWRK